MSEQASPDSIDVDLSAKDAPEKCAKCGVAMNRFNRDLNGGKCVSCTLGGKEAVKLLKAFTQFADMPVTLRLRQAADEVLPLADGCLGFATHGWCVERPNVFLFTIEWDRIEDHLVGFRGSELFVRWRELIGPHFDGPPVVEHFG